MKKVLLSAIALLVVGCGQGTIVDPWYEQVEQDIADLQAQNEALQALIDAQEPGVDLRLVDPCPAVKATFEEVLVCINDEILLALYYDHEKKQSFFAELPSGTYVTTDSRKCKFVAGERCSTDQL